MAPIIPDQQLPRRSESGLSTRAMQRGTQTPTGWAIALDSTCMLNSPETAAELASLRAEVPALRARVAELEQLLIGKGTVDEDPICFALTDRVEQLPAAPRVRHLRELADRQRAQAAVDGDTQPVVHSRAADLEDPHDSPLHHAYLIGRDLPEVTR